MVNILFIKLFNMTFDFNNINLIPKMGIVSSRNDCDTSVEFGKFKFRIPVVPANMECVINESISELLSKNGIFYIMHRFDSDLISFVNKMKLNNLVSSISVGVNDDSYLLINQLKNLSLIPDYITIDIAHGHSIKMMHMIRHIKEVMEDKTFIIAGNVSSIEGVKDLEMWGADCVKVGVGPGSPCTTYPSTGFGSRGCQASVLKDCYEVATKPLIIDGGIKEPGDISKSIALGASMVMVGGMLSGFIDSPGDVIELSDKKYKEFWGSASQYQSNKSKRIEGTKLLTPFKDKYLIDEMNYIHECLQSSISYSGGNELSSLRNVKYIIKN